MLWKRLFALGIILTLIIIVIFNTLLDQKEETSDGQGVFVAPPGMDIEQGEARVGELAPNFQLENLEGEIVQLADFKGKKIFVNFWATWCGPCKEEMPDLQKFYEKYQDEVVVLGVNTSETNTNNTRKFVTKYNLTFPILLDLSSEVAMRYKALGLPTTYFINSNGIIQIPPKMGPLTYNEMVQKLNELD